MENFIETLMNPIQAWRTTDNMAFWVGGYVVAAVAGVGACWGAWAFVSGLFAQASQVAGI